MTGRDASDIVQIIPAVGWWARSAVGEGRPDLLEAVVCWAMHADGAVVGLVLEEGKYPTSPLATEHFLGYEYRADLQRDGYVPAEY